MYIDKKFSGWCRFYFPDDIDIPEFKNEDDVEEFINDHMLECENLYDTEEYMSPKDNFGEATIEVWDNDDNIIWENGN